MAIEFLVSEEIISKEQKKAGIDIKKEISINEKANYYKIENKKFKQYRVNPTPDEDMKQIPNGSKSVIIITEVHAYNIAYSKQFR